MCVYILTFFSISCVHSPTPFAFICFSNSLSPENVYFGKLFAMVLASVSVSNKSHPHTYTGTDERTVVHSQAHEQRACSASKWEETPQLSVAGTGRAVSLRRPQPMHNGQESLVSLLL